ncbi:MAG: hypothetical protein WC812_03065 [Candidatus Pacearchaeota archaeon]|jgi:hypothetical protein
MKTKRGWIFGIGLSLIIISAIIISAFYLDNATGYWARGQTNITGTTLVLDETELGGFPGILWNVSNCGEDYCSNGEPIAGGIPDSYINMIVNGISGHSTGDKIYFEVYEKDTQEGGVDDSIRVGAYKIEGTYNANAQGIGTFVISLGDILSASQDGAETDGIYEFYFKVIVTESRGGESKTFSNVILYVQISGWDGNLNNVVGSWVDKNKILEINQITVNALDLLGSNQNSEGLGGNSNALVHAKVSGIGANTGTPTVFEIIDQHTNVPIRTGASSIYSNVTSNVSYGPWYINLNDISLSRPNQNGEYEYYFRMHIGQTGVSFANILKVIINWTDLNSSIIPTWLDYTTLETIDNKIINSADLGKTPQSSVYIKAEGFPEEAIGKKIYFEIYEKDDNGIDDPIRVGKENLSGTIGADSLPIIKIPWTITQADILKSEEEASYDYYLVMGVEELSFTKSFRDSSILRVTINGDIQPNLNFANAQASWRNGDLIEPITEYFWSEGIPNIVSSYIENITGTAGTPIWIEIWEHDVSGDNDKIRSVENGTALLGYLTADGKVYALWTITEEDLIVAGYPNETSITFYPKIISGTLEKDFSENLLTILFESYSCININYCSDYLNENYCVQDYCQKAENDGIAHEVNCNLEGTNCGCSWDNLSETCEFIYSNVGPNGEVGSCNYDDNAQGDTCDDGFLSYIWNATWNWANGNSYNTEEECEAVYGNNTCIYSTTDFFWHYDPESAYSNCIQGENTIICPSKVQLSFLDWRNIISIIAGLILIYLIIYLIRKRNLSKKKNKISKKTSKKK